MHDYSIELRIISDKENLDFDTITKDLGIAPNNTRQIGEYKSRKRVWDESMWGYSISTEHGSLSWDNFENGLESLLKLFMPLKEKIAEYGKKYYVVLWCGHFTSSFDGGPTFSPELLKKLGEFGVELFLDTYCCEDDDNLTGRRP